MTERTVARRDSITLRLPAGLLDRLREIANDNDRSINGEIVAALRAHVALETSKKKEKGDNVYGDGREDDGADDGARPTVR